MGKTEKKIRFFFDQRIKRKGRDKFIPKIEKDDISGQSILKFLKKNIKTKKTSLILDAGCGEGRFTRYLLNKGKIIGMDFSKEYVKIARKYVKGVKFVVGSVTKIPFPSNKFDYIFLVDVLQHVPELEKSVKELNRVLKPKGTLIIIDKNRFALHRKYFIPKMIIKRVKDKLSKYDYSKTGTFKERWFFPLGFKKYLKEQFKEVNYLYIIEPKKNKIFKLFPNLNLFVAWMAKKENKKRKLK